MNCELPRKDLVSTLVRYEVFIRIFDGDADAWFDFVNEHRGDCWADSDYSFLLWLKTQLNHDPGLVGRIRSAIDTIDNVLGEIPYPAEN